MRRDGGGNASSCCFEVKIVKTAKVYQASQASMEYSHRYAYVAC
jgi:hypothetical protein